MEEIHPAILKKEAYCFGAKDRARHQRVLTKLYQRKRKPFEANERNIGEKKAYRAEACNQQTRAITSKDVHTP